MKNASPQYLWVLDSNKLRKLDEHRGQIQGRSMLQLKRDGEEGACQVAGQCRANQQPPMLCIGAH